MFLLTYKNAKPNKIKEMARKIGRIELEIAREKIARLGRTKRETERIERIERERIKEIEIKKH